MSTRRIALYLSLAFLAILVIGIPIRSQYMETTAAAKESIQAGRNVNMVSGTRLPLGDPWLQRQNEPSIAVSTRNPMHLMTGANDYRTIDVPDDFQLPGIEGTASAHDAWLGVYESFDGGESWVTALLHGYPQDGSPEGQLSPIKGYQTACDPIVRAGANGLFYYCGIAFDRSKDRSAVFVARYQDNNNLEKVEVKTEDGVRKYIGPIRYIDTKLVATGSTSSSFIDMPNMAVDVPRKGALYGNVYVAYTVFSNTSEGSVQDRIFFQRSTDGGATWSTPPVQLSAAGQLVQRPMIAIDPIDLYGNTIYVAFRRFAGGGASDGIVVVRSTNGGKTFSKLPDVVPSFYPFDQGTSNTSFRTNSYPTMAVGDLGTVYLAWSQRQGGPTGQARIMISAFRKGGLTWSSPKIVDRNYTGIGHQFMPSLTFSSWRLMLVWYDQRGDAELDSSQFIEDSLGAGRHTIDVRAAEGTPGVPPSFSPSIQVSRYLHVLDLDEEGNPKEQNGYYRVIQAESNYVNYPLFQLGTAPFLGDYIEITPSYRILPPAVAFGSWIYNINPLEPTNFHAAWADNRDVRPPNGDTWGDWSNYSAPNSTQDTGWQGPGCSNGSNTGMRNQNIYTANINRGIIMGSPGNTKQLDLALSGEGGRTFVVFVKNTTEFEKTLKLAILQIGRVNASFDQFGNDDSIQVKVQPFSSVSCTVYVDRSTRTLAPLTVNAFEGLKLVGYVVLNPDPTNLPLSDPANPFQDLGNEYHYPDVSAPVVWNYDVGSEDDPNPSAMLAPRVQNPRVQNYSLVNPRVQNTGVLNPRVQNESVVNNEVPNPRVQNTGVQNTALTDVTWTVTNEGNTTSAYSFNIISNPEGVDLFNQDVPPLIAQVLVYRVHKVPLDKNCQLFETHQDELIANVSNPRVQNPRVQNAPPLSSGLDMQGSSLSIQAGDLGAQDVTFYLAPGNQADVIFRVWDPDTTDAFTFSPNMVSAEAVAEAVNTVDVEEGGTDPSYDIPPNPQPWITPSPEISASPAALSFLISLGGGTPAPQNLDIWNSGGGNLSYAFEDDSNWLSVYPDSGTSGGDHVVHSVSVTTTGLAAGTYNGEITVRDPLAANNPLKIPVTLTIYSGGISGSEWTNRWGPAGSSYQPVGTAVDAFGNTYVTGIMSTITGETQTTNYCTIKIDSLGQFVWAKYFDRGLQDRPAGIAIDSAGNIIVTGSSTDVEYPETGYDYATIKYNGNGDPLWLQFYNGAASGHDYAKAIAVDAAGDVYVTGSSTNGDGNTDYATIKLGAINGNPLWTSAAIYNGLGSGNDDPVAVAADSSGNVFVTGSSDYGSSGGFNNYATMKYDRSTGNQMWEGAAIYDGREHGEDIARAMAVDSDGNVIVTGSSNFGSATAAGGFNYATIKYTTNGATVWSDAAIYSSFGALEDVPVAIAVDSSGDIYVTGYSEQERMVNDTEFFDYDYVTVKYLGADGSESWVAEYAGPGGQYVGPGGDDWPVALAVDSAKNVYVTGYSIGVFQDEDYATVRYDRNGNELWVRRYSNGGMDRACALALDSAGNAYVTGRSEGENTQLCTIKYNPGLVEWADTYDGSAGLIDWASDMVTDSAGNVYVTGTSTETGTGTDFVTLKLDNAGHRQWLARYDGPGDDSGKSIAVDSAGNVYVTGTSTQTGSGQDITTIKYNSSGNQLWLGLYSSAGANNDSAAAIGLDSSGQVLVSGSAGGEIVTIQYDSAGNELWVKAYEGPNPGADVCHDMAVSPSGNVYVIGEGPGENAYDDFITIKYGNSGNELWAQRYDAVGRADFAIAVAVDSSENVYVAGYGETVATGGSLRTTLVKYDSGGEQQWATINDSAARASSIALDSSGNAYVVGVVLTKYDSAGNIEWNAGGDGDSFATMSVYVDSSGNIYAGGYSYGLADPAGDSDCALAKFDGNGNLLWRASYVHPGDDAGVAIAADPEGNIFLVTTAFFEETAGDIITIKYRNVDY